MSYAQMNAEDMDESPCFVARDYMFTLHYSSSDVSKLLECTDDLLYAIWQVNSDFPFTYVYGYVQFRFLSTRSIAASYLPEAHWTQCYSTMIECQEAVTNPLTRGLDTSVYEIGTAMDERKRVEMILDKRRDDLRDNPYGDDLLHRRILIDNQLPYNDTYLTSLKEFY